MKRQTRVRSAHHQAADYSRQAAYRNTFRRLSFDQELPVGAQVNGPAGQSARAASTRRVAETTRFGLVRLARGLTVELGFQRLAWGCRPYASGARQVACSAPAVGFGRSRQVFSVPIFSALVRTL